MKNVKESGVRNTNLTYEISAAFKLWRYTVYSSFIKVSLRNSGSFLGVLWEPISTLIISILLSLVWMKVLNIEEPYTEYFIYVYSGMVIWGSLSAIVSNLCSALVRNSKNLTTRALPLFSYISEAILISMFPFFMSLPLLIIVILVGGHMHSIADFLFFILGLSLLVISSFAFSISIGLLAFFVGDIRQIVNSIMRLSFLLTPIIWRPERLGDLEHFLLFNPFYGFLHIFRKSLLGQDIQLNYVYQALFTTFSLVITGLVTYRLLKDKIQERALSL